MKLPPLPSDKMRPARDLTTLSPSELSPILTWYDAVSRAPMNIWDRLPKKKRDYWHSLEALFN